MGPCPWGQVPALGLLRCPLVPQFPHQEVGGRRRRRFGRGSVGSGDAAEPPQGRTALLGDGTRATALGNAIFWGQPPT